MDNDYFSNLSFPQPKEAPHEIWATLAQRLQRRSFEILNIFPIQMYGGHTNAKGSKLDLAVKRSNVNVQQYFSNFGRALVSDELCPDSAPRHPRFWRWRFLKVFNIYGHDGHFRQWAATILTIFRSPNLRRLHMKFEHHWPRGFRGEVVWKSQHCSHTNVWCTYKCIGNLTWPRRKKVKR